jgi:hypothetical protein
LGTKFAGSGVGKDHRADTQGLSLRVLSETGVEPVDYRTVTQQLPVIAKPEVQHAFSAARAEHRVGHSSKVFYDVSTLYFQTDTADGLRQPGFFKEWRMERQVTIGLPLAVEAFEGNRPRRPQCCR